MNCYCEILLAGYHKFCIFHRQKSPHEHTVDLENFGVKKLCKAQTLMKLKHTRFFYYENFTVHLLVHSSSFYSVHSCMPNV